MDKQELLSSIIRFYLDSQDYNGLSISNIQDFDVRDLVSLINDGLVEVITFNEWMNPNIRAYTNNTSIKTQTGYLQDENVNSFLFPTEKALKNEVETSEKPYTSELKHGKPQLEVRYFSPEIIESYIQDPHYSCNLFGYFGELSLKPEYYEANPDGREDVNKFGLAYIKGSKLNRAICVLLRDLSRLSTKQQMRWKSFELEDQSSCEINKDFYRDVFLGEWNPKDEIWVQDALLMEMQIINEVCNLVHIPEMFRKTYSIQKEERPLGYRTIFIPTKVKFGDFIVAMEKLLISNLCEETFLIPASFVREVTSTDEAGKKKGTLVMLEEWLIKNTKPKDNVTDMIIRPLREIRHKRQEPAHGIYEDEYDENYYTMQLNILKDAYVAIAMIRVRLTKHPLAKEVSVPKCLQEFENIMFA